MKIISASIFMFFGVLKLYTCASNQYRNSLSVSVFIIVIGIVVYLLLKSSIEKRKIGKLSQYKETAETLYGHRKEVKDSIENICLGYEYYGKFDKQKLLNTLIMIMEYISMYSNEAEQTFILNKVRKNLEKILFKEELTDKGNTQEYLILLKETKVLDKEYE